VGRQNRSETSLAQAEAEIRAFLARSEHEAAATLLFRTYSDELLGYLVNTLKNRELAREAFAVFARDMWLGLPKVELHTSARAWAYAVARNAARRTLERVVRERWQELPLSQIDDALLGVPETRASTPPHLRTENKTRVALLRERLTLEDQEILILRVDRNFDWREIAVALAPEDELDAAAARYRKRFQLIKRKLAKLLREEPEQAPASSDQN
jgi:RNA polymerase sigma-70 factor, ECF subfamily